ncbi:MAG: EpsG family protein [Oscillospiraceae bacterium]|jgi:transmembrane protein EpsG|nr:EpsG family protein [Oscillospiraceae bacterium]
MNFIAVSLVALVLATLFAYIADNNSSANELALNGKRYDTVFIFLSFFVLFAISATRVDLGDTIIYAHRIFPDIGRDGMFSGREDPIANAGIYILFKIWPNAQIMIIATSLITLGLLFRMFAKYSSRLHMTVFLFIASNVFETSMNATVQFVAVGVSTFAIEAARQKKLFKFLLFIVIASLIHQSAIIMLPVYWMINAPIWSLKIKIIFWTGLILGGTYFTWLPLLNRLLALTRMGTYQEYMAAAGAGINIFRIPVIMVPVIFSWMGRKKIAEKYPHLTPIVHMSVVNAACYFIALNHWLFGRLTFFLEIYNFAMLPIIIECAFEDIQTRKTVESLAYVMYFLFFCYQLFFLRGNGGVLLNCFTNPFPDVSYVTWGTS